MGMAIDTIGFSRLAGASADTDLQAASVSSGDSFSVRSFPQTANAKLENIFLGSSVSGTGYSIRSPMFHDNVNGIELYPGEFPTQFVLPQEVGQPLISQDTLNVRMQVRTAAKSAAGALSVYYSNLMGASARLHNWGDISGDIKSIKPLYVEMGVDTNAGVWKDSLITNAEDLLHANKDYAVLGYILENACTCVGIKGTETGNLRICGPGSVRTLDTSDYFIRVSERQKLPHIPVINSANKDSLYVSTLSDGNAPALITGVQLILAELENNLPD